MSQVPEDIFLPKFVKLSNHGPNCLKLRAKINPSYLKLFMSGILVTTMIKYRKLVPENWWLLPWLNLTMRFLRFWKWFVGGIWKSLYKWARKSLECCNHSLMDNSGRSSEDQIAKRNVESKDYAHRFQVEMRSLQGIGIQAIHVTFWQKMCLCFVCVLRLWMRLNIKVMD
jgi:hypothetical protein